MRIEILYPEVCNLFGDMGNIRYLKMCMRDAEFIETPLNEKPRFLTDDIDMVYMAPTTEKYQEKIISLLSPFADVIKQKIDDNIVFFFTGNSWEIFGKYIEKQNGEKIEALGLFDYYVKQDMFNRHNSECIGKFGDITVMGFKSQFTMCYPNNNDFYMFELEKGDGYHTDSKFEGIHVNNFIGTYLLGPIFIMNPEFTKFFINDILSYNLTELPFENEVNLAFNHRLSDFNKNI